MDQDESNLFKIVELLEKINAIQEQEQVLVSNGSPSRAQSRVYQLTKVTNLRKLETFLFFSVLEGEFYLQSCQDFLKRIAEKLVLIDTSMGGELAERVSRISIMLDDYIYIKDYVLDRSAHIFQKKIFNFDIERRLTVKTDADYDFLWLFSVNVRLAEIDEGYSADNSTISILLAFLHDLNVLTAKRLLTNQISIISLLKVKCSILFYKILKRLEKVEKIDINISNDHFSVPDVEEILNSHPISKAVVSDIELQYYSYEFDIDTLLQKAKDGSAKIADVHKIVKHFKKAVFTKGELDSCIVVLDRLIKDFEKRLSKIATEKHKYIVQGNEIAYRTTINLLINTRFSVQSCESIKKLEKKYSASSLNKTYQSLKLLFSKDVDYESESVPNFMLYRIYLDALIKLMKLCGKNDKVALNEENAGYETFFEEIFNDAFSVVQKFREKVEKSAQLNLMPLYLEIEECNKEKFFLDSQYILPSDYPMLSKMHDSLYRELRELERIKYYIIPENIRESLKEVFKKEVKEHQYSVITIIGLYASFITFVLANVNILPDLIKHSMGAVFAFMLVLGVTLFFFVGTLKMLFSSERHFYIFSKKTSYFLLWLIFAVIITAFALSKIEEYSEIGITTPDGKTVKVTKSIAKNKNVITTKTDSTIIVNKQKK